MARPGYQPKLPPTRPGASIAHEMVFVAGGPFLMGTDDRRRAYGNERPLHEVQVPDFWIDTTPVTSGHYREFVEDGGYHKRKLWTEEGWAWREEAPLELPHFWERHGGEWCINRFGHSVPVNPQVPVQHVCFHEAQAFARWAGKGLPTEQEWEKAASWDPIRGVKRTHPWGEEAPTPEHANLDQINFGPMEVGAYPLGVSAYGCHQMIGDVWEWVDTDFYAYPGFVAWPYQEYSDVFFRPRVQDATRRLLGSAAGRDSHHLPQLGLPHPAPDLQRLPLRPGWLTPGCWGSNDGATPSP
jgi:iron(II)-dependent oxidoreductase